MNWSRLGYGLVLADFSALTAYAVSRYGFVGVFEQLFANAATITLFVDVCISLGLIGLWMIRYLFRRAGADQPAPLVKVATGRLA
jgi:hypothetical protein